MEHGVGMEQRLRKIMKNLTLKEFADSIGITVRALSYYLAGRTPRYKILQKICATYNVSLEWLRTGKGDMYGTNTQEERAQASSPSLMPSDISLEGDNLRHVAGVSSALEKQPTEKTGFSKKNTCDMSQVFSSSFSDLSENLRLRQKLEQTLERMLELQNQIATLIQEKADTQLELERTKMNVERRDMRIRELEEENARLREARKGPSPVFRAATGEAN